MIDIVNDPLPTDAALRALWLAAWSDEGPKSFQPILQRSLAHVGAFDAEKLVGFVNVAWDGGIHAFILDTCVDPDYRRQSVATRLVQAAAELAKARGAKWLHVDFERHLTSFYRSCGFGETAAGLMAL